MSWKCSFFGHDHGPWFLTQAGACSQHPSADGIKCNRCGDLLWIYSEDKFGEIEMPDGIKAPAPVDYPFDSSPELAQIAEAGRKLKEVTGELAAAAYESKKAMQAFTEACAKIEIDF